jgi:PAS domain S-box-containing protein
VRAQRESRSHSQNSFQDLLLKISATATEGAPASQLIQFFCEATRRFFQVDGSYFWKVISPTEFVGVEADGLMAEGFRGARLNSSESNAVADAVRSRKTEFGNQPNSADEGVSSKRCKSLMAAPLVVSNEVIGVAVFVQQNESDYFDDDLAVKATILAGQLASLLEASQFSEHSREEHRRAEILADVAQTLHSVPEPAGVISAVAERLRILLRAKLVSVMIRRGATFDLTDISAESPELAVSVRSRHDRKGLQFATELANRALAEGHVIPVSIDAETHVLAELVPGGVLLAAPFRTTHAEGALLVYPRENDPYSEEEKSLVSAVAGFGAVAVANSELYATTRGQANELHQLLNIAAELGSLGNFQQFMSQFVFRACEFLGFERSFVALIENGDFRIRWNCNEGKATPTDALFPHGIATAALLKKEPFWSDHPADEPGVNLELIERYKVRQMLCVPLLGTDGNVLGMLGVLDRVDNEPISQEGIRRAGALAAQVAIALEVTRNLDLAEQHRARAESLMALALELSSLTRVPELARRFVSHATAITGAPAGALIVQDESTQSLKLRCAVLQSVSGDEVDDESLNNDFAQAVYQALALHPETIVSGDAADLLGGSVAERVRWNDCTLVRFLGATGQLVGVFCMAQLAGEDEKPLLQAISGHASVALENARFFTLIDRANRHWIEIFDAITDFIVSHDEAGNILRANRSLAEFIGVEPKELIGVNMCALLAIGTEGPTLSCPFCRSTGEAEGEYVHPVLERTFLVSTSRVHGSSSEVLQTIHVLKDITDRREAERRYRELFDNIQEGLFFSTPDGRFIEVNDALVRMLGYSSREELLQTDVRSQVYFSPEQLLVITEHIERHGIVRNREEALRHKDGSTVHVLINAFAVRDVQGRMTQYRGLILDISGLKNFQTELHRERDFTGKILNNTQSLVLVTDTTGMVSYANRRWYDMGYQQRQVLGCPMEDLVVPTRRDGLNNAFKEILAGSQVDNLDLQILRGDGKIGHFSVNLSPMRDEQGQVTSVVVIMSDITDAATLQSKLMHAEKMAAVGQLVSGVAHEVNNPLTAILGFADLLMENTEVPESARKDLRVILQEAQRTKQIVQNLLSFARQMPPQRKPVQLNTILRRTLQLRAYDFHSRGVEVIEKFDADLPFVVGDAHQLQQVFLNIVNNAYDAVRDSVRPAQIEIRTSRQGGMAEISFTDNGPGISFPDRIFDPFFTTKEIGKGTGLGLSICYGIVREHNGEISCHNNAGGEGATFVVRFPTASESVSLSAVAGVTQT